MESENFLSDIQQIPRQLSKYILSSLLGITNWEQAVLSRFSICISSFFHTRGKYKDGEQHLKISAWRSSSPGAFLKMTGASTNISCSVDQQQLQIYVSANASTMSEMMHQNYLYCTRRLIALIGTSLSQAISLIILRVMLVL